MQTIKEARKYQYNYHSEKFPYLDDWKHHPYTFLKSRFYMELSAVLVHFLLKTKIKPNTVTIIYGLSGVVGCVLLVIPSSTAHFMAILVFFTKGILDWSDGHFARVTGQTSETGHVLDTYGALLNDLGFQIGLGFYVASKTNSSIFYYLIVLIPFCYAAGLKSFSHNVLFEKFLDNRFIPDRMGRYQFVQMNTVSKNAGINVLEKYRKIYKIFFSFLDARARNVDFICLMILIEIFTSVSVTWIIFIAFVIKRIILFLGGFYLIIKKSWVEKSLETVFLNIRRTIKESE